METVIISRKEYEHLKAASALFQDTDFLLKLNRLAELFLVEKWGIVLPEDTTDLTAASTASVKEWNAERSAWDAV